MDDTVKGQNRGIELSEDDVKAMVRIVADACATPANLAERRRSLMSRLAAFINADKWMWNIVRFGDGQYRRHAAISMLHDGFDDAQLAALAELAYSDSAEDYRRMTELAAGATRPVTRRRDQLISDEEFYDLETTRRLRDGADLDHYVVGFHPVEQGRLVSCWGFHRRWGRPAFSSRETRIVHILLSEVRWMHTASVPDDGVHSAANLSPRLRTVLNLFVDGQSIKNIAGNLTLSEHTVRGYVKDLYKHFDVNSRAALMRRFMVGDGGDVVTGSGETESDNHRDRAQTHPDGSHHRGHPASRRGTDGLE